MRKLSLALAVAALLVVASGASASVTGEIVDIANDANVINNQGLTTVVTVAGNSVGVPWFEGQDTSELSYDPADLRKVNIETLHEAIPVGDDGVDYRATGIVVRAATTGTPASDGPTLIYRLTTTIEGCSSFLQTYVRGPAAGPTDTADGAVQWRQLTAAACPDGATTQTNAGWTQTIDSTTKEIVMTFPYSSMSAAQRSLLTPGQVMAVPQYGVRTLLGVVTAPQIDETAVGADFMIGSDMPADVPCTAGCP